MRKFIRADFIRPQPNIGCGFDIPNGDWHIGFNGEAIVNGGQGNFEAYVALPNNFKTALMLFKLATLMERYEATGIVQDFESTLTLARIANVMSIYPNLSHIDVYDPSQNYIVYSDIKSYKHADEWWDVVKEYADGRSKDKSLIRETPFWLEKANCFQTMLTPSVIILESMSGLPFKNTNEMSSKNSVGDKKMQTYFVRSGLNKAQLISQITGVVLPGGIQFMSSAHIGLNMDLSGTGQVPVKKLSFLQGDQKIKKVPDDFLYLPNNCYNNTRGSSLTDPNTKEPLYPKHGDDKLERDTDLMEVTTVNLRGKSGMTGLPFKHVYSQRDGLQRELTDFHYVKEHNDRFGISGNNVWYHMDLYPDVKISRTTVRSKLADDRLLSKAVEFTSEICQLRNYKGFHNSPLYCTPQELYRDLEILGYDWPTLWNTQNWYGFRDKPTPLPYLSIMDLFRMRAKLYVPYWYPDDLRGKLKV